MTAPRVMDERGERGFRERVGGLLAAAATADFAVARIRLAALDLSDRELARVRRCRVLLRQLDASLLADAVDAGLTPDRAAILRRLARFAASGRLQVRAAGVASWVPDFSVFRGASGAAALLGGHQFGGPYPIVGPHFTVLVDEPDAVPVMARRFDELWHAGHDVLPAIREALESLDGMAIVHAGGGGEADAGRGRS